MRASHDAVVLMDLGLDSPLLAAGAAATTAAARAAARGGALGLGVGVADEAVARRVVAVEGALAEARRVPRPLQILLALLSRGACSALRALGELGEGAIRARGAAVAQLAAGVRSLAPTDYLHRLLPQLAVRLRWRRLGRKPLLRGLLLGRSAPVRPRVRLASRVVRCVSLSTAARQLLLDTAASRPF